MGSLDRRFGLDHEDGAGLTHKVRLRFDRSHDGSAEGHALAHAYVDVHATFDEYGVQTVLDVPVTAADREAYRLMCKIAATYGMASGAALEALIVAQWGEDVKNAAFGVLMGSGTGDAAFAAMVEQLAAAHLLIVGE